MLLSINIFIMLVFSYRIKPQCVSSYLPCFNRCYVFYVRSSSRQSNKSHSSHHRSHHKARNRSRTRSRSRSRSGSAERKHRHSHRSSRHCSASTTHIHLPAVETLDKHHHHKKKAKRKSSTSRQRELTPALSDNSSSVETSSQHPSVSTCEHRRVTLSSQSSA